MGSNGSRRRSLDQDQLPPDHPPPYEIASLTIPPTTTNHRWSTGSPALQPQAASLLAGLSRDPRFTLPSPAPAPVYQARPIPQQFPTTFSVYKDPFSWTLTIGIRKDTPPIYAVSRHLAASDKPVLMLHSGPDATYPVMAAMDRVPLTRDRPVMLPAAGVSADYGRRPAGTQFNPAGGLSSREGAEIVAAWGPHGLSSSKAGMFEFIGTGASGMLGERWAVMAVISALTILDAEHPASEQRPLMGFLRACLYGRVAFAPFPSSNTLDAFHGAAVPPFHGVYDGQTWLAPGGDFVHTEAAAFDIEQFLENGDSASTGQFDFLNDMNMDFATLTHFNAQHLDASPNPASSLSTPTVNLLDFTPSPLAASPTSTSSTPSTGSHTKRTATSSRGPAEDDDVAVKRQRNTLAARKYRQKRLDRIKELEDALDDVKRERDELRLKLARQEAQTEALQSMLKLKGDK
ncbi:unnamed protein product [Parascedosporium putredinis]|uniref:BZIP domain-containing protein n=1 Tax=Parascedosporium putredinis TaxID=1442378 RepID=A0A9P1H4Q8_9PEZI|nr:unnamed protein product [Parascedosporium putredinis]CAI7996192.1 unnamed protein product [Parascedosporium putredinis]